MTTNSNPRVSLSIVSGQTTVSNRPQKVLFVGQKTPAGTATAGALDSNIQNDNSWDGLYGADSMLAAMIRAARKLNDQTQFDAISLDDAGGGVDATATLVVTGTATEAGTLTISVGSQQNNTVTVAVADGDTATVVGDSIEAAINADTTGPADAANVTGTVTLTAVNAGTYGNTLGLEIVGTVAGISVALTGFSGGATDPTLTGLFDVVGDTRYQGVVWPYADSLTELKGFLDPRFNVNNDILDGVGFSSKTDTLANNLALVNAENSESLCINTDKQETTATFDGPAVFEIPVVKAAQFAAIRGLRLTDGASIAQFVTSANGGRDAFGGPALASKPYFNTPFPDLPLVKQGRGWTATEIDQLKDAGGWVIGNNKAANTVIAGEVVTTYKTDNAGNPDLTFGPLNFVDTSSNIREYYFNNYKARFAQSRLTEGDLVPNRDIANKQLIENFSTQLYQTLSGPEFVLTQSGEAARQFYIQNLEVSLDLATGSVDIVMSTPIVTQLREIIGTIRIVFSTEG